MSPRSKLRLALVWLCLGAAIVLARYSPSATWISVTGRQQGDIHVERVGLGPQRTRVEAGDVRIESTSW